MTNEIQQYLDNPKDFTKGLALFQKYVTPVFQKETEFLTTVKEPAIEHKIVLTRCLQHLLSLGKGFVNKSVPAPITLKPVRKITKTDDIDITRFPEEHARLKEIIPIRAAMFAKMKDTTISNEERKKIAAEVCKFSDERDAIWKKINQEYSQ